MNPHHFAPLPNCNSCLFTDLYRPFLLFPSLPLLLPSSLFLLTSRWISCLSAVLSGLICTVTLEVCDIDLPFQEAIEGFIVGLVRCGGLYFLAQETAVNQIVKDEVFLSSHLESIPFSSAATQKRAWQVEKAALHACTWTQGEGGSCAHF